MKLAYICSRYADPDPALRRRNIAEARALARWAEAQGYAVVTWWGSIEPTDPPCDSDETVRRDALARSAALAGMVGKAGGVIIGPDWYEITMGMFHDLTAFVRGHRADVESTKVLVSWSEVEPYYTAPTEVTP